MLLLDERRRELKNRISITAAVGIAVSAIWLLIQVENPNTPEAFVYKLADWAAPFGIVLVADRLSALMVLVTAIVGTVALIYSISRWAVLGPRFHSLLLLLLMGLSGAFLTGDLFNLYVFFGCSLAASVRPAAAQFRQAPREGGPALRGRQPGGFVLLPGRRGPHLRLTGTLNIADLVGACTALPDQIGALLRRAPPCWA